MILVTGGLGFLGSHIALSLMAQGQEVILVDNLANASLQTLERLEYISGMYVPFVKVDVRNTPALNKVFEQYSIDAVIHTAGFKSLEESRLKPLEYYNDNVSCIMSLLRSMQRTGVRRLVHLSSLAIYGKSGIALSEDESFDFSYDNPYIKSQQMVEEIIRDTVKTDNEWQVAILRLSNVVGAFEHGVLGENVAQLPKNIVPLALQVAAMQRDSLELQKNVDTSDKTVERSFIHVLDVCEAVFASLYWLNNQHHCCESFNIAQDNLTSISSLIKVISEVTNAPIETHDALYTHNEIAQLGADISKAEQLLNWKPKRSLEKMIEDEWRFYQNTLKGQ
ncbi:MULTISPECIES: UDP-glucose 4-epimerase GalE [unclassified Acinetobacter]|uniref:UDP-glucose 4-epimerase GalE n=1 Tax=unclassified Acinetobacter TaxID=196816 RepID=UPI00190E2E82|nr:MULTISPECIES: UDP-glucose 4-epimerase GalE [unclassified Acinetobacter]MBK0063303.1 UDP-glucose 4-epimerase GalE [Acinetobacter sp. S55]MBK0066785.1 UDP-glucose 4-epimerase GalE [Acinetobacter sp. S54]